MASGTRLKMSFESATGSTINHSINYIDPDVETASVKALMEGIIANGSIYANVPASMKSAVLVTTDETLIDLDA